MSAAANTPKTSTTFLWVLGAFTSFAVLLAIFLNVGKQASADPREPERLANKEEIAKAQLALVSKMGINDAVKKAAVFDKTLALIASRKPAPSTQVVPGSPTQHKQAAAPAPAAAPAAAPTK